MSANTINTLIAATLADGEISPMDIQSLVRENSTPVELNLAGVGAADDIIGDYFDADEFNALQSLPTNLRNGSIASSDSATCLAILDSTLARGPDNWQDRSVLVAKYAAIGAGTGVGILLGVSMFAGPGAPAITTAGLVEVAGIGAGIGAIVGIFED